MLDDKNRYSQGTYSVQNRDKYIGKNSPTYRSSWEKKFFYWCDNNKNVIRWGSEIVKLSYFFEVDNKIHNYIVDVYVEVKNNEGFIEKWLVEIKPSKQGPVVRKDGTVYKPKQPKTNNRKSWSNYKKSVIEYIKNSNKWDSAKEYCKANDMKFVVITEEELFNKIYN
jgi:hypothetical protein